MVETPFCEWQIYGKYKKPSTYFMVACLPDDPDAKLTCAAHLAEGEASLCPHKPEQIYDSDGKKRIAFRNASGGIEGVCEDFELSKQTPQSAT